jgi:hypothetical protein
MKNNIRTLVCKGCEKNCTRKYINVTDVSEQLIKQVTKEGCRCPKINKTVQWSEIVGIKKIKNKVPVSNQSKSEIDIGSGSYFKWNKNNKSL